MNKKYPIVVSSDGSDSNAATTELTASAQNGRAYGAIKVDAAGAATSTGTETLADAKNLCTANTQAGTSPTLLQRSYYDGWRTIINWSQDPGRRLSTFATVDTNDTGYDDSVAIGTDGFPVISYRDNANGVLRVAHCNDAACATSTKTTLDSSGNPGLYTSNTGLYTSIAIGTDGFPVISYNENRRGELWVAHCDNVACTTATLTIVDATGYTGTYTSIAIGTDTFPVVSYLDATNADLRVAHCNDKACATSTKTTVDSAGNTGYFTSIAIGTDTFPVVSYWDPQNGDLRVAHCINVTCSGATDLTIVDAAGTTGSDTSVAIGTDGFPVISYQDRTSNVLRVAHCINVTCSGATDLTTVDATGWTGLHTSVAIGTDTFPVVSYWNASSGDLRVAHCNNAACTTATLTTVDAAGATGLFTSVAIGDDGFPVISYHDDTTRSLRMVHCANVACT
ncbi:unannotated protein [freshwater metagenome]|uniref:Unannotated protein n=1 Tax=freshwater metagenome TaxID=449393 RepID=A0A6J7G7Z9_9ZZZZ|nr:hypothetical protein [Actinomycetota bacterium]